MDLRFPIGDFDLASVKTGVADHIRTIAKLPEQLKGAVDGLDQEQIDTPYRPDGWTVRQLVHHVADSHLNAYTRFKLALTEDSPTIRPYFEDKWAELADSKEPLEHSFKIIDGVHHRWAVLLGSLSEEDFQRPLLHPESGTWELSGMLALYDWHSRHHTAHITSLRQRKGW